MPLALALKVKNDVLYEQFVSGRGENILRSFALNTYSASNYADRLVKNLSSLPQEQVKKAEVDALIVEYENLFIPESKRRGSENLQDFHEAIALIGSYTTIFTEGDE